MKRFLYASPLMLALLSVQTAFGWTLKVTNWTPNQVNAHCYWSGCKSDHKYLNPGETWYVNAYECLLTEIAVDGGTSYKSSGQRVYQQFYIIGPVHGEFLVGRIK